MRAEVLCVGVCVCLSLCARLHSATEDPLNSLFAGLLLCVGQDRERVLHVRCRAGRGADSVRTCSAVGQQKGERVMQQLHALVLDSIKRRVDQVPAQDADRLLQLQRLAARIRGVLSAACAACASSWLLRRLTSVFAAPLSGVGSLAASERDVHSARRAAPAFLVKAQVRCAAAPCDA